MPNQSGMGDFLAFVGIAGALMGVIVLIRGSVPRLHLAGAKQAGALIAAGFVITGVGAATAQPAVPQPVPEVTSAPPDTPPAGSDITIESTPVPTPVPSEPVAPPPAPPARPAQAPAAAGIPQGVQEVTIARHVDGDTFWVQPVGPGSLPTNAAHKIRVLEIDTPENTNRVDCFGPESSAFARSELPVGSTVFLLADREDTDRYGRFLRYVWKANGEFYNDKAVRQGFAKAVLYAPNDRYIGQMRQAEAEAKAANRGLWSACGGSPPAPAPAPPAALPAPGPPPAQAADPPPAPGFDPSKYLGQGNAYNCPDIPSQAEAQAVLRADPTDPNGLDGDADSIACESSPGPYDRTPVVR